MNTFSYIQEKFKARAKINKNWKINRKCLNYFSKALQIFFNGRVAIRRFLCLPASQKTFLYGIYYELLFQNSCEMRGKKYDYNLN